MIDDEALRIALARLRLHRFHSDALVSLALDLLDDGRYTPALGELATLPRHPSITDAAPLFVRACAELGLPPADDAAALDLPLWQPARRIAAEIVDCTRPPLAGAHAMMDLWCDFDHPDELYPFVGAVATAYPGSDDRVPALERAVIDAARKLLQK